MSFLRSRFVQAVLVLVLAFVILRFGIRPPAPWSVLTLYIAIIIVIPLLIGYYAYTQAAARPQAPPELRAVHPAPPASIQFRGKEMNISGADNPLRKDAARFKEHSAKGGEIY